MTQTEPAIQKKPGVAKPAPKAKRSVPEQIFNFFASLRLTVTFLTLAVALVFIGTLAQVEHGLYEAQSRFFRSLFVYWSPEGASWKIPVFPGGYLVGGVLLLNLVAAHFKRFEASWRKLGISIIHAGIVLLLLGQFATDMLQVESAMQLFEGQTKNYSEDFRANELVIVDVSDPQTERVYSIPESMIAQQGEIRDPRLPFVVRVKNYWRNAEILERAGAPPMAMKPEVKDGVLGDKLVLPQPEVKDMERRNVPAAAVELLANGNSVASFLVYSGINNRQGFTAGGKRYEVALRFTRYYHPFSITLLKATHEKYKGTEIPKNFASRVRVENPEQREARETVIYMNNPLRYSGMTFFQYQMAADEMAARQGLPPSSTFQVVRNPGWLTPYLSCVLVTIGLIYQFMYHLIGFIRKRRAS